MPEPIFIGHALKVLNHKIRRLAEASSAPAIGELTEAQARVLGYLTHHQNEDICQRDVEDQFGITRATASKMLGDMERKGFLLRCGADYDARRKNLRLTERALHRSEAIQQGITTFEELLTRELTEAERQELLRLLRKVEQSVDAAAAERKVTLKGEKLC